MVGDDFSFSAVQFPHTTIRLQPYSFGKLTPAFEENALIIGVTLPVPCSVLGVIVSLRFTLNIWGVLEN